jgi:hypothetical protein
MILDSSDIFLLEILIRLLLPSVKCVPMPFIFLPIMFGHVVTGDVHTGAVSR